MFINLISESISTIDLLLSVLLIETGSVKSESESESESE